MLYTLQILKQSRLGSLPSLTQSPKKVTLGRPDKRMSHNQNNRTGQMQQPNQM